MSFLPKKVTRLHCYLLMNAVFLSTTQIVKSLTNHLVNLLGSETNSKKYVYPAHASVSPSHQELAGDVPVFTGPPADTPCGMTVLTDVATIFPA